MKLERSGLFQDSKEGIYRKLFQLNALACKEAVQLVSTSESVQVMGDPECTSLRTSTVSLERQLAVYESAVVRLGRAYAFEATV